MKTYYVYIMASRSRTLYVGITSNLEQRVYQHKNKLGRICKLVPPASRWHRLVVLQARIGRWPAAETAALHRPDPICRYALVESFTSRYNIDKLVYYAETNDVREAIAREKQIKGWLRRKKKALIEEDNPRWEDLSAAWYDEDVTNARHPGEGRDSSLRSE